MTWTDDRLRGSAHAVIDGAEFAPFWSSADPRGMSRDEAGSLAVVLARIGVGVEPDVRFAGPPLRPGPVVLFRLDPGEPGPVTTDRPSAGYRGACQLLAVAAATVLAPVLAPDATDADPHSPAADRSPAASINRTVTALAAEVPLTVEERTRLGARLRWLLASGVDAAGLRRRTGALSVADRDAGAQFLLRLVAESTPIGPADVAALIRGYRLLDLPDDQLYARLHHVLTHQEHPGSPTTPAHRSVPDRSVPDRSAEQGPVLVRRGRPAAGGHALPWVPPQEEVTQEVTPADGVSLRKAVVGRRLAETETVAALLAEIFIDDTDPDPHTDAPTDAAAEHADADLSPGLDAGLDAAHHAVLTQVAARPSWSATEFAELAAGHGLLPVGALEVINDLAIEITGQPVVTQDGPLGDDLLEVDAVVIRELLG